MDSNGKLFISRVFNKHIFPFATPSSKTAQKLYNSRTSIPPIPMYKSNQKPTYMDESKSSSDTQYTPSTSEPG